MTVIAPPTRALTVLRAPNRTALKLTGRPYVSHTQLSLMRACPRKFAFEYIEQAPKDFLPVSLAFGSAFHSAIESYYRGWLTGAPVDADQLLQAYRDAWEQQIAGSAPVRYNVGDDAAKVDDLGQRMLTAFLGSPLASPKGIVLGVEETMTVELHADLPDVLARVDLVLQTPQHLHLIDFKTSRARWKEDKAEESADQLLLYGSAAGALTGELGLPPQLLFAIITKAKNPVVQLLPVKCSAERTAALITTSLQTWSAICANPYHPDPSESLADAGGLDVVGVEGGGAAADARGEAFL